MAVISAVQCPVAVALLLLLLCIIMRDSVVRLLVLRILVSLVVPFCDRLWYSETDVVSEYSYDHAHCRLLYLYDIIFYPCAVRCYRLWKRFYNHNSWFLDTYHSVIDWCPFSAGLQVVLGHRGRRVVSFGIRAKVRGWALRHTKWRLTWYQSFGSIDRTIVWESVLVIWLYIIYNKRVAHTHTIVGYSFFLASG